MEDAECQQEHVQNDRLAIAQQNNYEKNFKNILMVKKTEMCVRQKMKRILAKKIMQILNVL